MADPKAYPNFTQPNVYDRSGYHRSHPVVSLRSLDMNSSNTSPPPYNSWHEHSQPSRPSQPSQSYQPYRPAQSPQCQQYQQSQPPQAHGQYQSSQYSHLSQSFQSSTPSDEELFTQTLDFIHYAAPPPTFTTSLPHPIAIPQTTAGLGQSFLRAWAPILQSHGIAQRDLLNFIDNLNVVSTANPPLQALNAVGAILGMVPNHIVQATAFGLQVVAKVGTSVVSKGRTEIYMKEVNERMFKPRGLKATIATTPAVRTILTMPQNGSFLIPLTSDILGVSPTERVLTSVRPYSAPLELNVPPPTKQTTMLARISAKQVERQTKRGEKKALKNREKALEDEMKEKEKDEEELRKRQRKEKKRERKAARKEEKKQRKADRKNRSKDEESETSDSDSDSDADDRGRYEGRQHSGSGQREGAQIRTRSQEEKERKRDKELKTADKLLWIVIENLYST